MTHLAFIGLGAMGAGMAAAQARAGVSVAAYDLNPSALEGALRAGCNAAASASDAVRDAQVVITMLPAAASVTRVMRDEVLPNARAGALLIDCSTIDVASARTLGDAAGAAGFRFADAPVSGGVAAAASAALTFMVGCEERQFCDAERALAPMARAVIRAGDIGAGQAAKICNNMVLGVSMLGVCEAFALAEKLGLEPQKFFEIATQSSGQCWSLSAYCPWPGVGPSSPADHSYEGGFLTSLMLKDLRLAQAAAALSGVATPMGAQAEALYALFDRLGFGRKDFSSALQVLRGDLSILAKETPAS